MTLKHGQDPSLDFIYPLSQKLGRLEKECAVYREALISVAAERSFKTLSVVTVGRVEMALAQGDEIRGKDEKL